MLLLSIALLGAAAEVVLLRFAHGNDDDRHTDEISCVYDAHADNSNQLFSAEKLLERVVLPDALWCDSAGTRCHDATSSRDYVARSLDCSDERNAAGVRCRVRIDCTELISAFWLSLLATLLAIIGFILVPALCCDGAAQRRDEYERDTSL